MYASNPVCMKPYCLGGLDQRLIHLRLTGAAWRVHDVLVTPLQGFPRASCSELANAILGFPRVSSDDDFFV